MASTCGRKARGDAGRQDLKELLDGLGGEVAAAENAGQRAEKDAERKERDDEREGDRARHGEPAVLVEPVNGLEQGAVTLHSRLHEVSSVGRNLAARSAQVYAGDAAPPKDKALAD